MCKVPGTLAAWGSGGRGVGWGDAQQGGGAESKRRARLEPPMVKSLGPRMETTGPRLGSGNREPAQSRQDLRGRKKRRCCLILFFKGKALGLGPVVSGPYSLLAQRDRATQP